MPAWLLVSVAEPQELKAGCVEQDKTGQNESQLPMFGLDVVSTWESLQFPEQVSNEIKVIFQGHVR